MILSWIPPQTIKIGQAQRSDLSAYVVYGIHIAAGTSEGKPRAWKVNPDGSSGGEIAIPVEGGKADSVSCAILSDGSVRFVTSRASAPGASGSSAVPFVAVVPGVFPPMAALGGGNSFVPAPGNFIRIKSVRPSDPPFNGQETIGLSAFGIPNGIALLNIKLTTASPAVGARGRVGPHMDGDGAAMLFEQTQVGGNRMSGFLQSVPGPNHSLVLWADAGALTEFYVDVLGWWY